MMFRIHSCRPLIAALLLLGAPSSTNGQQAFQAFDNVITLAKASTPELSSEAFDVDVQVIVWAPTAMRPSPFLRLTHTPGGDLQGHVFVWWFPGAVASHLLPSNRRCTPADQPGAVCVSKIEVTGEVDWGDLLSNIFGSRACGLSLSSGPVTVVSDAGDLIVRVRVGTDRDEDYFCNGPGHATKAGAPQAAQVMGVLHKLAAAARPQ